MNQKEVGVPQAESGVRIGELAREFGLNPRTLRYYEAVGLLRPHRTPSGYRVYVETDRERLRFVLRAKRAGFTLREMREVVELKDRGQVPCEHVRRQVERKLREVEARLQALQALQDELRRLRRRAGRRTSGIPCVCPILEGPRDRVEPRRPHVPAGRNKAGSGGRPFP
ncbi:MAG: heavy metal-responsive transcriptional regulator [Armatimonadota bacterium]|nr:heavy metal-responsive transcriptional regulator [Armatimonadota bacterium]MDR7443941.1 heavy metal-responsive transcriptional regulator [Armatimonadota bacterium]MDR7570039.1 heavy metal-responsive transcriptional regulator [Armatimonadota bacterium]MDR7613201.1 heavy metal-responsive transcriptional regulator [Armatimonadota bacterium]